MIDASLNSDKFSSAFRTLGLQSFLGKLWNEVFVDYCEKSEVYFYSSFHIYSSQACCLLVANVSGDTFKKGTPLGLGRSGRANAGTIEDLIETKCKIPANIDEIFCANSGNLEAGDCDAVQFIVSYTKKLQFQF